MSTLNTSEKTHQAVLPQRLALESIAADTPRGWDETGNGRGSDAASGVQHDRGENLQRVVRAVGRHPHPSSDGCGVRGRETALSRVFVLDKHGRPLQPCHPGRARQLLAAGRARVVHHTPFVIRLVDRTVEDSQVDGVHVGVDPGSRTTGIAVFTQGSTVDGPVVRHGLMLVEVEHRSHQISERLKARAGLRRGRRSRNLRYRQPRFNNRTKPAGWLPPSLRHRVETTMAWIVRLQRWAPVVGVHQELVRFDMQQMVNPEISGVEYQQGALAGFEAREYLLAKWSRRCVYCDATGVPLNIDHVHPRSRGGSNRISNLVIACIPCNQTKNSTPIEVFLAHDPARLTRIRRQMKAPLRDAAAVNTTRWALHTALVATGLPVTTGSGGRTKWNRTRCGVPKTHALDALCVGTVDTITGWPAVALTATATGRGRYSRTRSDKYGFPRLALTRTKRQHGYSTGDLVRVVVPTGLKAGTHQGRVAVRSTGKFNIKTRTGLVQGIHHRHCQLIQRADGWAYQTTLVPTARTPIPPGPEGPGFLGAIR